MQKLPLPTLSSSESYSTCVSGVVDNGLRVDYETEAGLIERVSIEYLPEFNS